MDPQKKKELLLKEQRKLKQTQLPRKSPAAPAYIDVTPPAKDKHAATDKPTASTQSPALAPTGIVTVVQKSQGVVRIPPSSTLTPKQGMLISA